MALVDGGAFTENQRSRLAKLFEDYHSVDFTAEIAPFCLAITETPHSDYWECAKARQCVADEKAYSNLPTPTECLTSASPCSEAIAITPISSATDKAAVEYCAARGSRLPTIAEWYWAALGGTEDRHYPWGASPPSESLLNVCDSRCATHNCDFGEGKLDKQCLREKPPALSGDDGFLFNAPIGAYPSGAGRWGHLDLLGNVAEYASMSAYRNMGDALCGGSFRTLKTTSLDLHGNVCPMSSFDGSGIRCAADPR